MADAEIGRVLNALDDTGLPEETLVVLTSDHGDGLARHGLTSKMFLYDEAARVPFIAAWPGRIQSGVRDTQHLVSGLDVAPTLCDYAGIEAMPKARGLSLRKLLENRESEPWRDFLVAETLQTGRMVRTPEHKYITYQNDPVTQLFDMRADPGELKNLASDPAQADVLRTLAGHLDTWESSLAIYPLKPLPAKKPANQKKPKKA
jgi:choline-sulfatase